MEKDINNVNFLISQEEEAEDEADESLSFSDLPLHKEDSDDKKLETFRKNPRTRSSSEPLDLFEFFTTSHNISPAEDLIFCGRLIPLNDHYRSSDNAFVKEDQSRKQFRKRSESLSELQGSVIRSNSTKINLKRNSRSLDHRKLYRQTNSLFSTAPEIDRDCSIKNVKKKPRWYLLMFGMVKLPAEMELSDIKSRQVRRNSAVLFPTVEEKGKLPSNRSSGEVTWRLLRALSCKNHASVDVTASLTV